jgi:hypothetical protein
LDIQERDEKLKLEQEDFLYSEVRILMTMIFKGNKMLGMWLKN